MVSPDSSCISSSPVYKYVADRMRCTSPYLARRVHRATRSLDTQHGRRWGTLAFSGRPASAAGLCFSKTSPNYYIPRVDIVHRSNDFLNDTSCLTVFIIHYHALNVKTLISNNNNTPSICLTGCLHLVHISLRSEYSALHTLNPYVFPRVKAFSLSIISVCVCVCVFTWNGPYSSCLLLDE